MARRGRTRGAGRSQHPAKEGRRPPGAVRKPIRATPEQFALPETDEGTVLFNVPFPRDAKDLKRMAPIIIRQSYHIDYIHSYGQDSPYSFAGTGTYVTVTVLEKE